MHTVQNSRRATGLVRRTGIDAPQCYNILLTDQAKQDYRKLKSTHNAAYIQRIERMIHQLKESPTVGIGHPEPLKHELSGYWSRRIDRPNRLVYRIDEDSMTIIVQSLIGHYDD